MARGKAEDAGGLTPVKDDNAAPYHFDPRTLPIFKCVDYIGLPDMADKPWHRPGGEMAAAGLGRNPARPAAAHAIFRKPPSLTGRRGQTRPG